MDIILLNDGDDDVLIPPLPLLRPKKKILRKQTKVKKRLHSKLTGKKGRRKAKFECSDVTSVPNVMETRSCHTYDTLHGRMKRIVVTQRTVSRLTNHEKKSHAIRLTNHDTVFIRRASRLTNHKTEFQPITLFGLTNHVFRIDQSRARVDQSRNSD